MSVYPAEFIGTFTFLKCYVVATTLNFFTYANERLRADVVTTTIASSAVQQSGIYAVMEISGAPS
jgi:hypothetical protein